MHRWEPDADTHTVLHVMSGSEFDCSSWLLLMSVLQGQLAPPVQRAADLVRVWRCCCCAIPRNGMSWLGHPLLSTAPTLVTCSAEEGNNEGAAL